MHIYMVQVESGGILAAMLHINFHQEGRSFHGYGGGVCLDAMIAPGAARFNFPLESMRGWEARFAIQSAGLGGGTGAMQLWAMDGRRIGDVEFDGTGLVLNFVGGRGRFS